MKISKLVTTEHNMCLCVELYWTGDLKKPGVLHFSLCNLSFLSVSTGTREAAFVYALSAATISHTIARACTSGDLRLCSCGPIPAEIPEPGYRWGGCADNLHYGLIMGSKFSDAPMKMKRTGSHANKLMHLHNSEVGRQVSNIGLHLKTSAKCKVVVSKEA